MTMTTKTGSNGKARALATSIAIVAMTSALGCSAPSGETVNSVALRAETPLPARAGTVVVDGCVLDPWQRATLAGPGAKRVLQEVILLCLVPRLDGTVGPRDPSALQHLGALIADLGTDGYRVSLAVAFTDETGQRYDGPQTRAFLADPAWRARVRETLVPALAPASGVELDLQNLPDDACDLVTAFVTEVAQSVRSAKRLGVFVPPSTSPTRSTGRTSGRAVAGRPPISKRWRRRRPPAHRSSTDRPRRRSFATSPSATSRTSSGSTTPTRRRVRSRPGTTRSCPPTWASSSTASARSSRALRATRREDAMSAGAQVPVPRVVRACAGDPLARPEMIVELEQRWCFARGTEPPPTLDSVHSTSFIPMSRCSPRPLLPAATRRRSCASTSCSATTGASSRARSMRTSRIGASVSRCSIGSIRSSTWRSRRTCRPSRAPPSAASSRRCRPSPSSMRSRSWRWLEPGTPSPTPWGPRCLTLGVYLLDGAFVGYLARLTAVSHCSHDALVVPVFVRGDS
jgi:hypothetical protein